MSAPERLTCPLCERDYTPGSLEHHLRTRHAVRGATLRERWPDLHRTIRAALAPRRDARDRIACRICGEHLHHLGTHLLHVHGIDSAEYRRRFPGAPVASDHMRGIASDLHLDRHGPAYWTPERIIAAMQRWAQRTGQPPRREEWMRGARRGVKVLRGDRPSASRPSATQVADVFGSWGAARGAAGFGPSPHTGLRKRCRAGLHDLTDPDNLIVGPDGKRRCRACTVAPCRRCGGFKPRGSGVIYCEPCRVLVAEEVRQRRAEINRERRGQGPLPCRGCGGPKPPGRGVCYCDDCRGTSDEQLAA